MYRADFCKKLIEHFDIPAYYLDEKGQEIPNDPPLFSDFRRKYNINHQSFYNWIDKHADFADAHQAAKDMQLSIMLKNGLRGLYASTPWVFAMKNMHGWRDTKHIHAGQDKPLEIIVKHEKA